MLIRDTTFPPKKKRNLKYQPKLNKIKYNYTFPPENKQYTDAKSTVQFSVNHYSSSRTNSYKFNLTTGFRILVERLRGSEGDNVISWWPSTSGSLAIGELAIGTV